jgi:hypothetical protein
MAATVAAISSLQKPRHGCHGLVQCGVTIDARHGTSDPDNSCSTTKPELTYDLDAAGSSSFSAL